MILHIIPHNTMHNMHVTTVVQIIVNVSVKVPVSKLNRTHIIAFAKSIIKSPCFIRIVIFLNYNMPYYCDTIFPFTTLYLPAGNDCIY